MTSNELKEQIIGYTDDLPEWVKREGVGLLIAAIMVIGYWGGVVDWIVGSRNVWGPMLTGLGGFGTLILAYLYLQQRDVLEEQAETQRNQEKLMEQQFTPYLTGEVTFLNITSVQFSIRNAGDGPAFDVEAEWEVAGETRRWEVPSLPPGENFGFPVIVDGDDWLLSTNEIQDYLDDQDASSVIDYEITCKNRFDEERVFSGSVDFGVLITRSESDEIWDDDPLEEISNEMSKLQRDVRKMRRYEQKDDRASNWKNRIHQIETINKLIQEHGKLTVADLESLTNINEDNIKFRLQALDSAGVIYYNESSETAEPIERAQKTTLDDF